MNIYISDLNTICNKSDLLAKLTAPELNKYNSFKREKRANQFLVAHALKNDIATDFQYTSISHSDNIVLVAASNTPIGVDIEKIDTKRDFKSMAKIIGFENIKTVTDFYKAFTYYESQYKMRPYTATNKQFYKIDDYIICIASCTDDILPHWFGVRKIPEQI